MAKKVPKKPGNVRPPFDWQSPLYTLLGILAVVGVFVFFRYSAIKTFERRSYLVEDRPMILAHRGSRVLAPENTLKAFEVAKTLGADVLELDLRLSADNKVIVLHDPTLERTTNCTGLARKMVYEEMKTCDAGYHFTLDEKEYPFRGAGLVIPTFIQLLDMVGPDTWLNVEIKEEDPRDAFRTVDFALKSLKKRKMDGKVVWASRFPLTLDYVRYLNPKHMVAASEKEGYKFIFANGAFVDWLFPGRANVFQVPYQSGKILLGRPDIVRSAHRYGQKIHFWTVNDPKQMRRVLEMGADGFVTDRTDLAVKLFEELGLREKPEVDQSTLIPTEISGHLDQSVFSHVDKSGVHQCSTVVCKIFTSSPLVIPTLVWAGYVTVLSVTVVGFYFAFFQPYLSRRRRARVEVARPGKKEE